MDKSIVMRQKFIRGRLYIDRVTGLIVEYVEDTELNRFCGIVVEPPNVGYNTGYDKGDYCHILYKPKFVPYRDKVNNSDEPELKVLL